MDYRFRCSAQFQRLCPEPVSLLFPPAMSRFVCSPGRWGRRTPVGLWRLGNACRRLGLRLPWRAPSRRPAARRRGRDLYFCSLHAPGSRAAGRWSPERGPSRNRSVNGTPDEQSCPPLANSSCWPLRAGLRGAYVVSVAGLTGLGVRWLPEPGCTAASSGRRESKPYALLPLNDRPTAAGDVTTRVTEPGRFSCR